MNKNILLVFHWNYTHTHTRIPISFVEKELKISKEKELPQLIEGVEKKTIVNITAISELSISKYNNSIAYAKLFRNNF